MADYADNAGAKGKPGKSVSKDELSNNLEDESASRNSSSASRNYVGGAAVDEEAIRQIIEEYREIW